MRVPPGQRVATRSVVKSTFKPGNGSTELREKGSSLCLALDGKREELNVDFALSIESLEA